MPIISNFPLMLKTAQRDIISLITSSGGERLMETQAVRKAGSRFLKYALIAFAGLGLELLLNRDVRKAFPILYLMFVL